MPKPILSLLFLFLFIICSGQEYSYQHYTISDGLPQTQVTDLFQDSKGFIWVGTKGGLSRFDGVEFENFGIEDGLTSRIVCNISEGRDGNIYVLCDHGLSVFDGNKFTSYPFPGDMRAYMGVASVVHDFDGNIWIASKWLQEWIFLKFKDGVYSNAHKELNLPETIRLSSLLFEEADSSFWIGTEMNGIYSIIKGTITNQYRNFLSIQLSYINHDELFFVGRYNYNSINKLFKSSINDPRQVSELMDSIGIHLLFQSNNRFLISSYNNDYFDEYNNGAIIQHKKKYHRLNAFIFDHEGNLWVGSETGVYRLKSKTFLNFTKESGINKYVWSIVEDKKGEIWFASFLDCLSKYDGKTFTMYNWESFPLLNQSLYRGAIKNQAGDLLFTNNGGVLEYDGGKFSQLDDIPKAATLFLFEDTLNKRLIISSAIYGLVIRENNGKTRIFNISPGPIKEYISTINMDKIGRYWIGGFYGMSIMEGDSIVQLPTENLPYKAGAISSFRDSLDNLWFGTTSGLYLYDYNSFSKIESSNIRTNIMSLAGMAGNKLFIGMVDGIGILDLNEFYISGNEEVLFYNESNGFLGEECKQNGVLTDSKGYTWVATSDRVVRIDPKKIQKNTYKPRIYMKSVNVFSKRDGLNTKLALDTSNDLHWFQNDIRFDYHAVSHTAPEGVRYKYRLAGYNKNWSEPTKERYTTYTNLKYGDYEFQVKAFNCDQVWCENPAVFSFSITPAFWQTKFFLFGSNAIFLFFLMIGMLYFLKRKRLKKEEKEKIDKQFTELQLKTIKNQMDPHFTFNAITSLGSLIYTEEKETAYDYLVNFSRLIRATIESSDKISRTLKEELDFTKNYLNLQQFRFKNKLDYKINVEEGVNMETKVPRLVIQTHAENALKHGLMHLEKKGWLKINFKKGEDTLIIEISDNGIGREKAKEINKDSTKKGLVVTNQFYTLINKFNKVKIRQEIIDLCDGSGKSAGTKVTIHIPLDINYEL